MSWHATMLNLKTFHDIWWYLDHSTQGETFHDIWWYLVTFHDISWHMMSSGAKTYCLSWYVLKSNIKFNICSIYQIMICHDKSWNDSIWLKRGTTKLCVPKGKHIIYRPTTWCHDVIWRLWREYWQREFDAGTIIQNHADSNNSE